MLPNRLTPLYFKIYYKKENYLKVKTVVFKYITPLYSKGWVCSALVYQYIRCSEYITFPYSELMHVLSSWSCDSATPHLIALLVSLVPYPAHWSWAVLDPV